MHMIFVNSLIDCNSFLLGNDIIIFFFSIELKWLLTTPTGVLLWWGSLSPQCVDWPPPPHDLTDIPRIAPPQDGPPVWGSRGAGK